MTNEAHHFTETHNFEVQVKALTIDEISNFFIVNDNDFFEKLSDRIDIRGYARKLSEKSIQFTVYDNSKLVGLSPCYFNDTVQQLGYISALVVLDGYRRQGLGSRLLEKIKLYGNERSFSKLVVEIHCENYALKRFYEKSGFSIVKSKNNLCTLAYLYS